LRLMIRLGKLISDTRSMLAILGWVNKSAKKQLE